jgi:hypothetical protein
MIPNLSRRTLLKGMAAGGVGTCIGGFASVALAADAKPILDEVKAACNRLAPLGWRDMLLAASGGALDIGAPDLTRELLKPLAGIDRSFPGFGDFALAGHQGVQPGQPDLSLLYHAFAAATVVAGAGGKPLAGFPTLAEIGSLENYIYGVQAPSLDALRHSANGRPLGIVVYALHYRNTPDSVHGKHAELCFARTGIARVGTIEPLYDDKKRLFVNIDQDRPFDLRVTPQRFAAYLAVQMNGSADNGFGPQDALEGDAALPFWVPLHKLFNGAQCIAGMNLDISFVRSVQNEELAQFHKYLNVQGKPNNWHGKDLEEFPFTIRNERIASLSTRPEFGPGVLQPLAAPMTSVAIRDGKMVTFPVYPNTAANLQMSSLFVIPGVEPPSVPAYEDDAEQNAQREQPEYTNIRHRVNPDGTVDNLNLDPKMTAILKKGGYQALHYTDLTGDGWVEAQCPQLSGPASPVTHNMPAYCMVGLPDFFPEMTQRDLMLWTENTLPQTVAESLWVIRPLALSQTRIAANITLPIGFSIKDTTVTAIVSQQTKTAGPVQIPNGPLARGKVGLPDGSPGLFDPGWDTSQGIHFTVLGDKKDPAAKLEKFMAGYSLGSPFIEDAKLCAALGSYWPGVAPDATRTFQPGKQISGKAYPWPTVVPLTDREIGSAPLADGKFMPWDGVMGPKLASAGGKAVAIYPNIFRTDYIDLIGTMTAALTSRIDGPEYKARTLAMEAVYWNLGIHGNRALHSCHVGDTAATPKKGKRVAKQTDVNLILRCKASWAVLSFTEVGAGDAELTQAQAQARKKLSGKRIYRFHMFRWDPANPEEHYPGDMAKVLVPMLEQAFLYVDAHGALIRKGNGKWQRGISLPT